MENEHPTIKGLNKLYKSARYSSFNGRHLKRRDVDKAIKSILSSNTDFKITKLGESIEGRNINLIEFGRGDKRVFFWSQMHGNEPTGTKAIFDFANFLGMNSELDLVKKIKKEFKLFFLPMLNPDGAEYFRRENAIGIDLNRDAQKLISPESQILSDIIEELQPLVLFNLHDQDKRWIAGKDFPAAISLLAPPIDEQDNDNKARVFAKKLIVEIYDNLQKALPNAISRYNSEFEIRSFGDLMTKKGFPVILIESGKYFNDYEKETARRLNFLSFLVAFNSLIGEKFKMNNTAKYSIIPLNKNEYYDVILRNVNLPVDGAVKRVDLALNKYEKLNNDGRLEYSTKLEFVGDLTTRWGLEEINCSDFIIEPIWENIHLFKLKENSKVRKHLEESFKLKLNDLEKKIEEDFNRNGSKSNFLIVNEKANISLRRGKKITLIIFNGNLIKG